MVKRLSTMWETWIRSLGREDSLEKEMATQYSCLENPMDGGAWCPWGHKESDTTERLHFHCQASSNSMVAVTIHSDLGAQENKISHCFQFFTFYLPWSDGTRFPHLSFLMFWFFFFFSFFSCLSLNLHCNMVTRFADTFLVTESLRRTNLFSFSTCKT